MMDELLVYAFISPQDAKDDITDEDDHLTNLGRLMFLNPDLNDYVIKELFEAYEAWLETKEHSLVFTPGPDGKVIDYPVKEDNNEDLDIITFHLHIVDKLEAGLKHCAKQNEYINDYVSNVLEPFWFKLHLTVQYCILCFLRTTWEHHRYAFADAAEPIDNPFDFIKCFQDEVGTAAKITSLLAEDYIKDYQGIFDIGLYYPEPAWHENGPEEPPPQLSEELEAAV